MLLVNTQSIVIITLRVFFLVMQLCDLQCASLVYSLATCPFLRETYLKISQCSRRGCARIVLLSNDRSIGICSQFVCSSNVLLLWFCSRWFCVVIYTSIYILYMGQLQVRRNFTVLRCTDHYGIAVPHHMSILGKIIEVKTIYFIVYSTIIRSHPAALPRRRACKSATLWCVSTIHQRAT